MLSSQGILVIASRASDGVLDAFSVRQIIRLSSDPQQASSGFQHSCVHSSEIQQVSSGFQNSCIHIESGTCLKVHRILVLGAGRFPRPRFEVRGPAGALLTGARYLGFGFGESGSSS